MMQSGGILLFYLAKQIKVQHEIRKALHSEKTEFESLTLTLDQYNNSKINSREIFFNGNMYDIKSITITGDKVELIVINDTEEKRILEEIRNAANKQDSKKNIPNQLTQLLQLQFTVPFSDFLIPSLQSSIVFNLLCESIIWRQPEIVLPPPKLV
jgi:hypothetical protein